MTNSRKNYKTQYNYTQTQNLIRIGCTTTEISKFLKLSYNQAWNLRSDLLSNNIIDTKNNKKVSNISSTKKPEIKRRVATAKNEDVKVTKTKSGFKITVTVAI
jgi:hypothetical protein